MSLFLVEYSEKCVALFGDSGNIKVLLKEKYSGRYNPNLTEPGSEKKQPGWIFKKDVKDQIMKDLQIPCRGRPVVAVAPEDSKLLQGKKGQKRVVAEGAREVGVSSSSSASAVAEKVNEKKEKKVKEKKQKTEESSSYLQVGLNNTLVPSSSSSPAPGLYLVDYSLRSIAIFGDTKPIKSILKDKYSGKYNANLTDPSTGLKSPGWIMKKENLEAAQKQFNCPLVGGIVEHKPKEKEEWKGKKEKEEEKVAKDPVKNNSSPSTTSSTDPFDRLRQAKKALDEGLIEESDYALIKAQVMSGSAAPTAPVTANADEDDIPLSEKIKMAAEKSGERSEIFSSSGDQSFATARGANVNVNGNGNSMLTQQDSDDEPLIN